MENRFTPIKLQFIKEEAKERDSKGKVEVSKDLKGDIRYTRNDLIGLMSLLGRFDTTLHPPKDWKQSINIKTKITEAYLGDLEEIELTLDQASFLKLYLQELSEKDGKREPLPEHELRTLFGISEQLEGEKEK